MVLLTEHHGVIRAVARGARRPGSRFAGRLEPFMHVRVMLHRGRELDVVSQAETVDGHQNLRSDYDSFLFGQPMLELSWRSLQEGQDSSPVFRALAVSLGCLEEKAADPPLLLAAFELKLCSLLGFRPAFSRCAHCGASLHSPLTRFDPEAGGAACPACAPSTSPRRLVDAGTLALAEELLALPLRELAGLGVGLETTAALLRLAAEYTESHLGIRLRSHEVALQHLGTRGADPQGRGGGDARGGVG